MNIGRLMSLRMPRRVFTCVSDNMEYLQKTNRVFILKFLNPSDSFDLNTRNAARRFMWTKKPEHETTLYRAREDVLFEQTEYERYFRTNYVNDIEFVSNIVNVFR